MLGAISASLQPFKDTVGTVASYVTIAQLFVGVFPCRDIWKKKSTDGITSLPFVIGVVMGLCTLRYGQILGDEAMITTNLAAVVINLIFCIFYYIYSSNKWGELFKPLAIGFGIVAVMWGYAQVEKGEALEFRYGLAVTILMLLALGSPLLNLREILSTKDASSISFPITLVCSIVTFLWLLYGIIIQNNFMIFQNLVGNALCSTQLFLIFKYPKKFEDRPAPTRRQTL